MKSIVFDAIKMREKVESIVRHASTFLFFTI
jgi:hypothetical protein